MKISAEPEGAAFAAIIPGQPPAPFVEQSGPEGEATLENRRHDVPQRGIFRRCEADLCARVEGTVGGELKFQDWRYTRVR